MRETNLLTPVFAACSELDGVQLEQLRPGEGRIDLSLTMKDGMFNRILGEECGTEIHGDKHLLRLMKELRDETGMSVLIDDELYTVIVPGDINASGTVNTADMRLLQRVLVGETELTDTAALAADLNENGRPDAADLVLLAAKMQRD